MTIHRLLAGILGAALALVALSGAPAHAEDTIQLSGTITNSDGVNMSGTVCLEKVGSGSCGGNNFIDGAWSRTWITTDPGDYLVQVSAATMNGTTRWYDGTTAGTSSKASASPVSLVDGAPDFAFTMVMPAIAKVSGKVVDTGSQGVAGLSVLMNQNGQVRSTTTDGAGTYDFGYTRAGTWTITVAQSTTYGSTQTTVVVPSSGTVVVPDLTVQEKSSIGGTVTDAASATPIPFVDIEAYSASEPHTYLGGDTTDQLGHYVVDGLGNTPFVLRFTDPYGGYVRTLNDGGDPVDWDPQTPITLTEGEDRVYDQTMVATTPPVPAQFNLSGTVSDETGHPLPGIFVGFGDIGIETDRAGQWYLQAADGTNPLLFSPGVDWTGYFGSDPGWASESFPGRLVSSTPDPVTVAGGVGATGLDITLVRSVTNSVEPEVTGTATVGQTLTASTGTWSAPSGTTYATTWLRNGAQVASGPTYVVTANDAGRSLVARVTGTFGLAVTSASSVATTVARLATATTAKGASTKPGRVKITVTVTAPGLTPTGTVTVLRGTKVVKRDVRLVGGKATVTLKRQPEGRQRYRVTYPGAVQTMPSQSPRFRVKVL